jgi:hypothetical protein
VQETAALVQQGLTPKAALQRWVDAAVQRSAVAPAPAAVVAAPPATASAVDPAAELAARLGTPSDAQRDAALDARYRTGKTKTPSAPTAARMQAEADARIAAERATTPAPTVAPAPAPPPTKPTRVRTQKAPAAVVAASAATTDTPVEAAKTVTNQIERVIDTQGLKSGAAVQARVMEALTKEIQAAREAAGFGDITTRRTGTTGGVVSVDGEPVATWDKGGAVRWMGGGGVGMHGRSLGPPPEVLPGVPGDTPIGRYPINARNMSPSEVERAAKNAVAATISRTRGAGQMRVQIPGDGTFTIERNPHAINELMRRLQSAGVSIWKDLL